MQRQNNDPFTCQDINDTTTEPAMAHVIKIGKIHALTAGFQVNTNDNQSCVKGLHLGGHYYVKSYNGVSSYLVDCLLLKISELFVMLEEKMVLSDVDVTW
jgi:hypothetical protein